MAKLNLNSAIVREGIQNLRIDKYAERTVAHPFYGLRDSRGWLTRYPVSDIMISRDECESFIEEGVTFDSNEHWGPSPYKSMATEISPKLWRIYQELGISPWNSDVDKVIELILLNKYQTGMDWYDVLHMRFKFSQRKAMLAKAGWYFSNKTILEMSPKDVVKLLSGHHQGHRKVIIKDSYNALNYRQEGRAIKLIESLINDNKFLMSHVEILRRNAFSDAIRLFYKDKNLYIHIHCKLSRATESLIDLGMLREKRSIRTSYRSSQDIALIKKIDGRVLPLKRKENEYLNSVWVGGANLVKTRAGLCTYESEWRGENLLEIYTEIKLRKLGQFYVSRIGNKTVVFKEKDSLLHVEGDTLHDCMEKIRKAQIKELTSNLSFQQVKDRGWCIHGSKNFLKETAPFIYSFIRGYDNWSDVPLDIMELSFNIRPELYPDGYNPNSSNSIWI